jgi:hypothetical protein
LSRAIYYFVCRIDGGNALCLSYGDYLGGQICRLAVAADFPLVHRVRFSGNKIKELARVPTKYGVGLVIALVRAPSSILHSSAPGQVSAINTAYGVH